MRHNAKPRSPRLLRHRLLPLGTLAMLLASPIVPVIAQAQAQDQEPPDYTLAPDGVAVPRAVGPEKSVGVAGGVAAGGAVDVGGVASPQTTSPMVGLALAQVQAGTMTWQEAWEQKLLNRDDLIRLLSREHLDSVPGGQQKRMRTGLAGLLAALLPPGEAALQEAAQWNAPLRLSLADYYLKAHDARAQALYQGLLSEWDVEVKQNGPLKKGWVLPLFGLARFYAQQGDSLKAAQTWERAELYSHDPNWVADTLVEQARAYMQAGEVEKASAAYARASQLGDGWSAGVARFDQARGLIAQGKHKEARELLQQPIAGPEADQIKVVLLAQMGRSYYGTGDLAEAHRYSQQAIDAFNALPKQRQEAGLTGPLNMARLTLASAEQWTKEPIQVEPRALNISIKPGQTESIIRRLTVRTLQDVPLTVSTSNPLIKARVVSGDGWGDGKSSRGDGTQEVIVEIAPNAAQGVTDATINIGSSQGTGFQAQVPLKVQGS